MRRHSVTIVFVGVLTLALACDGPNTVNGCNVSASPSLVNSGIGYFVPSPYRCKYTISYQGAPLQFEVSLRAPSSDFGGNSAWADIRNYPPDTEVGSTQATFLTGLGGGCPQCAYATPSLYFPAGTGGPLQGLSGLDRRDNAYITVELLSGLGNAFMALDGRLAQFAIVSGPGTIIAPSAGTWQAEVGGDPIDTLSFQYSWMVNGTPISGATSRSLVGFPYGESGTYSVTGIAELMDQTTDTVTRSIAVNMGAYVDGPAYVYQNYPATWTALAYAARYPLTSCEWWVNTTVVSSGPCSLNYTFASAGSYQLSVYVTDSRSVTANGTLGVYASSSDPGCQPPDCYESLRGLPIRPPKGERIVALPKTRGRGH